MADPISASRFEISIEGYQIASFSELAGISSQVDPVDYTPSGSNETTLLDRFAARRTRTTIKLVRPRGTDPRLGAWHLAAVRNQPGSRKLCALRVYDAHGKPIGRYHLEQAWPSKIDVGVLSARTSPGQSETVTMTCEFIQRVGV
jgi:phage tail-like protein